MSGPIRRRRDPQPINRGWEMAVAVGGGVLVTAALAALAGVGIAAAVFGGGWVWPADTEGGVHVLAALLRGDALSGFSVDQRQLVASQLATVVAVVLTEVVVWAAVVWLGLVVRRRLVPGAGHRGMATRAEAEAALGRGRLGAAQALIRPDLHPRD